MNKKLIPSNINEHIISQWLYQAGYDRLQVSKLLRIAPIRLHTVLTHPTPYLTIEQYQVIATATDRNLIEVLNAVIFNTQTPPNKPQLWHEEQESYGKE